VGKNVAVFVDVANIFYAAKAAGVDIDYVTLLKSATAGRDLVRAYAYTGLDPENENQRNFHDFLRRHGFKVVSKDIRKYGDGKVKANLDIELVVDMLKTARNLDIAIVISGDGDFAPAIRAVQEMGVRVEVISFRGNTSSDLMDVADQFSDIAALAKVEKGSSRSGRRVAGDDADLSMTAVPEKQSEGVGGATRARGRGRGRTRTPEAEPAAARTAQPARESDATGSAGTIVALPGEKLSRARRTAPTAKPVEAESGLEEPAAAASSADDSELGEVATDEAGHRRRRRRRGGRGRGRGRDVTEAATEAGTEAVASTAAEADEAAEHEEPRPPVRANSTFGSIWDSQLGVSPGRPTATPARPAAAEVEDLDEPPIPEYLIAERRGRQGDGGPVRGRGPRGARGAYAAALDRERFGGGRGGGGVSSVPGGSRYAEPPPRGGGGGGGRRPEFRDARPPRSGGGGFGSGNEPWSEVPPELEAVLRAQLAARRPTPQGRDAARPAPPVASAEAAPTTRRPGRPSARRTAPPTTATPTDATDEPAAAPKRRPGRRAAPAPSPSNDGEAAAIADEAASKPRPTRRATTAKASATAAPQRRTTRKAASPDAG